MTRLTFIIKDHEATHSLANINGEFTASGLCKELKRFRVFYNGIIDDWNICNHRRYICSEGQRDGVSSKVFTTCEQYEWKVLELK